MPKFRNSSRGEKTSPNQVGDGLHTKTHKASMKQSLRTTMKSAIAKALPSSVRVEVVCSLPKIETWRKKYVGNDCPTFPERTELYDYLQANVIQDRAIDYLEFGVYRGESISHWTHINRNDQSRFFGFDTFTGLPEDWKKFSGDMDKDTFDCGGATPQLNDGRVEFIKGLFQDTLDPMLANFTPRSQFVLHNDSDLYSSTLYVLTRCHDLLTSGAIVIFDEFSSVLNEFRALEDYCAAYRRSYKVLGVTSAYFAQVAIRFE
jgi:O-methyltransferase